MSVVDIKNIRLAHTREGIISVKHIEQPYGEYSDPVISLSISNHGDKVDSKIEIPYANLNEVLESLKKSEDVCNTFVHDDIHGGLSANLGGGE